MKRILTIIILISFSKVSFAQDPHFSQFFSSPLTLNPAFTGKFNGNYRLTADHRNQWPTINNAFVTTTASIDFHILQDKINSSDMFGVGVSFLSDNSANSAVKLNYASISTAYHKGLDEDGNITLGVGLQGTYSNMFINTSNLKFEDQLELSGFTGISKESFAGATLQSNYFDLNGGVLFSGSSSDKNNYYAGVSMYHINQPQQKFNGTATPLRSRVTGHAGASFLLNDNFGLHLSGLYSYQSGATETLLGGTAQFITNPSDASPVSVYAGGWVRFNDAIIPYVGLEFSSFRLGMSYDVNTSSLKTASLNRGGMEISFIYTHQPNTDKPISCPKF